MLNYVKLNSLNQEIKDQGGSFFMSNKYDLLIFIKKLYPRRFTVGILVSPLIAIVFYLTGICYFDYPFSSLITIAIAIALFILSLAAFFFEPIHFFYKTNVIRKSEKMTNEMYEEFHTKIKEKVGHKEHVS